MSWRVRRGSDPAARRPNCGCCACRSSWRLVGRAVIPYRLHDHHVAELLVAIRHHAEHVSMQLEQRRAPASPEASRESRARPRPGACPRAFARSGRSLDRALARGRARGAAQPRRPRCDCCVQAAIFLASGSVALLADLIHNFGDALTAIPLGIAFLLRSRRAERCAGLVRGRGDLRLGLRRRRRDGLAV